MSFPWSISGVVTIPFYDATRPETVDVVAGLKTALTSVNAARLSATGNSVTFSGGASYTPNILGGIDKGTLNICHNGTNLEIRYSLRIFQYGVITAIVSAVLSWFVSGVNSGDYTGHAVAFGGWFFLFWLLLFGASYIRVRIAFPIWLRGRLQGFESDERRVSAVRWNT